MRWRLTTYPERRDKAFSHLSRAWRWPDRPALAAGHRLGAGASGLTHHNGSVSLASASRETMPCAASYYATNPSTAFCKRRRYRLCTSMLPIFSAARDLPPYTLFFGLQRCLRPVLETVFLMPCGVNPFGKGDSSTPSLGAMLAWLRRCARLTDPTAHARPTLRLATLKNKT